MSVSLQTYDTDPELHRNGDAAPEQRGPATNPSGADTPAYLTKRQAAQYLQVSLRTIDIWMSRRLICFIRVGRTVRFRKVDLDHNTGIRFTSSLATL